MMPVEPHADDAAANIAAAIGEPARARMLFALLDGRARTSTELALIADVAPSTASSHLARLSGARLLQVHVQGRHRYYAIENRRVAGLLERLSVVANEASARPTSAPRSSTPEHLVEARTCYDHIAGALGVSLHDALIDREWIAPQGGARGAYVPTEAGQRHLAAVGIDATELTNARRRFAFSCLDWSERRPHLAGALGASLLSMMLHRRWVRAERDSRGLTVTAIGARELASRLGVRLDGN